MNRVRHRLAIALSMLLLGGCAASTERRQESDPGYSVLLNRIQVLERKVARLEQQQDAQVRLYPARPGAGEMSPGERDDTLENLRQERQRLLQRYMPHHPDVRILDREIQRLQKQREFNPGPSPEMPMDLSQP